MWAALIGIGFYLNGFIKRIFNFFNKPKPKICSIALLSAVLIVSALAFFNPLGTATILAGYFFILCLIFDLVGMCYRNFFPSNKVLKYLYFGGTPSVLLTVILIVFGFINAHNLVITPYDITVQKDLNAKDIKIAFISDVHMGVSINSDNIAEYCDEIQAQNPDIILLGGDIFDERTTKEELELASKEFGEISSKYGTYFVWGNHEAKANVVSDMRDENIQFIKNEILSNNIIILNDDTVLIDDAFYIVGRSEPDLNGEGKSAKELLETLDKEKPIVVVEHKPVDFENLSKQGADLYLCGHTHSGQLPPLGLVQSFIYDLNYGINTVDNCSIIVSSGMGTWNTPLRLEGKSEVVIVNLSGDK